MRANGERGAPSFILNEAGLEQGPLERHPFDGYIHRRPEVVIPRWSHACGVVHTLGHSNTTTAYIHDPRPSHVGQANVFFFQIE